MAEDSAAKREAAGPRRIPVVEGLFVDTGAGPRLIGSRCRGCGTPYFPRAAACHNPGCDGGEMEEALFGPRGTLWSFAIQHYPPPPPVKYDEPFEPYAIGLVDLPEGLRLLARLSTTRIDALRTGMPVELVLERLCGDPQAGGELITWKFRPVAGEGGRE